MCMLPGRPVVENRVGLGAMAMGAVLEIALGIDILRVERERNKVGSHKYRDSS